MDQDARLGPALPRRLGSRAGTSAVRRLGRPRRWMPGAEPQPTSLITVC